MPLSDIEERAQKARKKKALYGPDVSLESYESEAAPHGEVKSTEELPSEVKKAALDVGVSLDKESSGAYVRDRGAGQEGQGKEGSIWHRCQPGEL